MLLLLPVALAAIPDRPPAPLALSADEEAKLAAREIVVRYDATEGGAGGVTGVVDVAAAQARVWDALLDFPARIGEVGGLKSVTYTVREADTLGARWELRVLATTVVFHALYHLDPAAGWVRYALDPTRSPNDLVAVEGAYQLYPSGAATRLVYRSEMDSGRSLPQWLKRWFAVDALTEQLTGVRARAERG